MKFVALLSEWIVLLCLGYAAGRISPSLEQFDYNGQMLLAQTMSQLKSQLADHIVRFPNGTYADKNSLRMILRAMYTAPKALSIHRRHSDRSFESHLIGTASCAISAGLQPAMVAALGAHGLYIKTWSDSSLGYRRDWTPCDIRPKVRQMIGHEAEHLLWVFTAITGHGPLENFMISLRDELRRNPHAFNEEDKQIILGALCDEFDEHVNGEQWWSTNFKRHTTAGYEAIVEIAKIFNNDFLVHLGEATFRSTQAVFPVDIHGELPPSHVPLRQAVKAINGAAVAIGDKRK